MKLGENIAGKVESGASSLYTGAKNFFLGTGTPDNTVGGVGGEGGGDLESWSSDLTNDDLPGDDLPGATLFNDDNIVGDVDAVGDVGAAGGDAAAGSWLDAFESLFEDAAEAAVL
jgi:hypothetical protein